jgi:rod shape-determining protein MreB
MVSGLPLSITITSEEVMEALADSIASIIATTKSVLERTPPELAADIIDRGIILTGGGALLHGLEELMMEELKVPVLIAEDPLDCVAKGTGILLDNMDKVSRGK